MAESEPAWGEVYCPQCGWTGPARQAVRWEGWEIVDMVCPKDGCVGDVKAVPESVCEGIQKSANLPI